MDHPGRGNDRRGGRSDHGQGRCGAAGEMTLEHECTERLVGSVDVVKQPELERADRFRGIAAWNHGLFERMQVLDETLVLDPVRLKAGIRVEPHQELLGHKMRLRDVLQIANQVLGGSAVARHESLFQSVQDLGLEHVLDVDLGNAEAEPFGKIVDVCHTPMVAVGRGVGLMQVRQEGGLETTVGAWRTRPLPGFPRSRE